MLCILRKRQVTLTYTYPYIYIYALLIYRSVHISFAIAFRCPLACYCYFHFPFAFICDIFCSGGHGCCFDFPSAVGVKRLLLQIYEAGGVIGAVCHGPAIFDNLLLPNGMFFLAGKTITGFSVKGEEKMGLVDWMKSNGNHNYLVVITNVD